MKKIIFLAALFLLFRTVAYTQSVITKAEYNKITQSAIVAEYPFDAGLTEDAISARLKALGYSGKSNKGFTIYKMVKTVELGSDSYDLYIRVERKSKKDKDRSVMTMLMSTGYEKFVNDTTGREILAKGKVFADSLMEKIGAFSLEKQISEQEDIVKKAEKKYNNAVDDGVNLEKKRRDLEADIEQNKKDQANRKTETEAQKQILETLKSKRK